MLPILESLIPGYAGAMLETLREGELDDLARMLELLVSLGVGGQPIEGVFGEVNGSNSSPDRAEQKGDNHMEG